jgi:hypothetical protein
LLHHYLAVGLKAGVAVATGILALLLALATLLLLARVSVAGRWARCCVYGPASVGA